MNGFTYESELYFRDRNTDTEQYWGNTDTTNTVSIQLPRTNYDNDFSSPSTVLFIFGQRQEFEGISGIRGGDRRQTYNKGTETSLIPQLAFKYLVYLN